MEEAQPRHGQARAPRRLASRRLRFEQLPDEVKLLVFSFLSTVELRIIQVVCREWLVLANEPSLWRHKNLPKKLDGKLHQPTKRNTSNNHLPSRYKVVMVGPGGCGRNAFIVRYVNGSFITKYDPVIADEYMTTAVVDGVEVILDLVVTGGQEEYAALREQFEKVADGILVLYSINSRASFDLVRRYVQSVLRSRGCDMSTCPPIILLANKIDCESERAVSTEEGKELANSLLQYRWSYFGASPPPKKNRPHNNEKADRETKSGDKEEAEEAERRRSGFCFRDNFFESSVKNNVVVPYGGEAVQGQDVVVEEMVRQIDEWRVRMQSQQQTQQNSKHDDTKRCLLM
ncbi:tRNA A64-2'-O-ribosylphosphate transferase [Balamuthia mandrillaris]